MDSGIGCRRVCEMIKLISLVCRRVVAATSNELLLQIPEKLFISEKRPRDDRSLCFVFQPRGSRRSPL